MSLSPAPRDPRTFDDSGVLVDLAAEYAKPDEPTPWRTPITIDGTLTTAVAPAGWGKTWLMWAMAHSVATGTPFLGRRVARGAAIVFDGELGRRTTVRRIRHHYSPRVRYVDLKGRGLNLASPMHRAWLQETILGLAPDGGFVGLDSLRRLTPGIAENATDELVPILDGLSSIAVETGTALLLLHHAGWKETARARGSSGINDASDAVFALSKPDGDGPVRKLSCRGAGGKEPNSDRAPEDVFFAIAEVGGLEVAGKPAAVDHHAAIRAVVAASEGLSKTAVAHQLGVTPQARGFKAAWAELALAGAIVEPTRNGWIVSPNGNAPTVGS